MLNFIEPSGRPAVPGFRWAPYELVSAKRDADPAPGSAGTTRWPAGDGSDPHGWRNALNYYGWGAGALDAGARVYDDFSYSSYGCAMKAAVRAHGRDRQARRDARLARSPTPR